MTDIFRTVLNMSITGAYISAVIMLLRLAVKKLPKKYSYALWAILGIRLLCPFSFSSAVSIFNVLVPEKPQISSGQMEYIPRDIEYSYEPQVTVSVTAVNDSINSTIPAAVPNSSADPMQTVLGVCAWVWLFGVIIMLIYTVCSYLKVRKTVADSKCIRDNIFVCGNIESPFVYGIIRPGIYVPEGVSEQDMRYIIAHENTHIKRGDHIIRLIAMAALCIHWFDPMVWISYRLMVKDMELSCDERAVRSFDGDVRRGYANALLNMSVKQNKLYGMLAFGENSIKSRIKGVLSLKKPKTAAAVGAVILLVIAAVCLLTNAESRSDIADGRYISGRNIAMAAYSSTFGDDSGYFYDFEGDTLTITPRENDMSRAYELSKWTDLPYSAEEWDSLTEMLPGFDMSGYDDVRYMKLDSSCLLIRADGELWIAEIRGEGIWSIYSLVPYDKYVNDNYNPALNSFEITRSADGYEVRSPLTDIYFFFTENEHDVLHVRRDRGDTAEETVIPYLGGFDPYKTGLYLSDITGDGTDDIFVNTYFSGTGVVDDVTAVIDGSIMEEIPINRLEAERLISESSAELLKNEDFTALDLYISADMPDMDENYIYPYYPDKGVRRYGGMMYELADGQVVGSSVFGFVRNESEYSKLYRAGIVFEYRDGELVPVSISVRADESGSTIPVHNSYAAVNKDGYVYNIPLEDGYINISPYIWGDPVQAPIAAEYSDNSLRLYPTENADGQYSLLRLLRDGENYYYEISDTNFKNWFTVDKDIWQTLEMNIDMYSLRVMHAVIGERLPDGKYIVSDGNADYTINHGGEFDVGDNVTVMYLGNVLAVDNAVMDVVEVIPENADAA
ncbi:MAG: M56 family metallopeptidase [Oscillospiraceae bacterium]|nr:M56 family metallopeptidase [Oscillospiraceae bacterium]